MEGLAADKFEMALQPDEDVEQRRVGFVPFEPAEGVFAAVANVVVGNLVPLLAFGVKKAIAQGCIFRVSSCSGDVAVQEGFQLHEDDFCLLHR